MYSKIPLSLDESVFPVTTDPFKLPFHAPTSDDELERIRFEP